MVATGVETSGRMIDCDCGCHLMIDQVSVESNQHGTSVKCTMSVLGSSDQNGQVGKTITEFFKVDGEAAGMFLNLAEAAGLVTRQQREDARKAGVGINIDENLLKGRQICAKITMKPNLYKNPATGKNEVNPEKPGPYPRIGFDTFGIWDKKAEGIPKDPQFAAFVPKPVQQESQQHPPAGGAQPQGAVLQPTPQTMPPGVNPPPSNVPMNW